jgi:hypothetical protein
LGPIIELGEGEASYRWCFPNLEMAQSFIEEFGGTIIQT